MSYVTLFLQSPIGMFATEFAGKYPCQMDRVYRAANNNFYNLLHNNLLLIRSPLLRFAVSLLTAEG